MAPDEMARGGWHWDEVVRSTDYLSVTEIAGTPCVFFVAMVRGEETIRMLLRHALRKGVA